MVTLPALFLATYLVGFAWVTPIVAVLVCRRRRSWPLVTSVRARQPILRRIVRESVPVLVLAGTIDIVAGLTIEKRFSSFLVYPALLVLVPPFLEDSGSLGGILSGPGVHEVASRHARNRAGGDCARSPTTCMLVLRLRGSRVPLARV